MAKYKSVKAGRSGGMDATTPSDLLYKDLLMALPDAAILVDDGERIMNWNARATEIFGWPEKQVLGKKLASILFDDTSTSVALAELAAHGERCRAPHLWPRFTAIRRDGDRFVAALFAVAVRRDGLILHLVLAKDISDSILAEQQLIQAQKLEAIGHLTGGLAHDFNNILGIIIGSLDVVSSSVEGAEERELLAASLSAAKRGAEITKSLLAISRRRAINPQRTDVNRLLDEITPLLKQAAGKNIEVAVASHAVEPFCRIDPGGLNNALLNLVINARDAMPSGGRIIVYVYSINILPRSLSAPLELKAGAYLVVGVDDEGSGMTTETAMRAFDPFFTTKERGRGTGLGLAMVYGFARQSGGTARIQSSLGHGTSVQMYLPTEL